MIFPSLCMRFYVANALSFALLWLTAGFSLLSRHTFGVSFLETVTVSSFFCMLWLQAGERRCYFKQQFFPFIGFATCSFRLLRPGRGCKNILIVPLAKNIEGHLDIFFCHVLQLFYFCKKYGLAHRALLIPVFKNFLRPSQAVALKLGVDQFSGSGRICY